LVTLPSGVKLIYFKDLTIKVRFGTGEDSLTPEIPQKIVLVDKKPGPELIGDFNVTGG
jgi:hypothetical protein